ncbi:FTR1 family iron permease [Laspinema olomoucense]|uniref:FTR1 family iron permease n=1 Tax=Laspinema olomoucense TaxID=3231600 RepID=UPI0021BA3F33|nr:FTR1 family protein [Laspinema sp. D3a]MCT7988355.1 FTR1 family protein [Laspinema sp. D3a]
MELSAALPTFLITLREGVEAALVVGIVLACLKKAQQSQLNPWVYAGVGTGIVASGLVGIVFGGILQAVGQSDWRYAPAIAPSLKAGFCLIAIAMLSWMLIWMTKQAKSLKGEVEGAVNAALFAKNTPSPIPEETGKKSLEYQAGWGVFTLIFIAVLREGFETVVFILAQFERGWTPVLGAFAGLIGAFAIGTLLFKWGVKINLRLFFQIMGVFLLLIVSGLVISALKSANLAVIELSAIAPQFASWCHAGTDSCILGPRVWDATQILPDNRFPGVVLKALFGYRSQLYLVQAVAYLVFLITAGGLYFQSITGKETGIQGSESKRGLSH